MDPGTTDVQWERTEALDGVDEEQAASQVADLAEHFQVDAMPAEVLDVADGEQTGALARPVYFVERVEHREPLNDNALRLQPLPREVVSRELLGKGDDFVARPP